VDWARAIERNSEALKGIIAGLFAMLELAGATTGVLLPRSVHSAVLRVLRPAESAMRRLIVIAGRGLVVKLPPSRPVPRPKPAGKIGKGGGSPRSSFQLFDARKNFAIRRRRKGPRVVPRIHFFGNDSTVTTLWLGRPPVADAAAPPDGLVGAERLTRRLEALKLALEDLPRQARRMARWRARRENMPSPKFRSPLRPGPPPGRRRKPVHLVDEVLIECHGLAFDAMKPDTS
jgi:hypothetical protein